jgi:TrmH family RNA methyltransferase
METITSAANPLLKDVRRASQRGSLMDQGCAVAESFHLAEEALRSGCEVHAVLAAESAVAAVERLPGIAGVRFIMVPDRLFQSISATENAQGVMALVVPRQWKLDDVFAGCPLVVVLDAMQDPGNTGAILRAAEAFGASGAMLLKGTASPHNPKTLRAAAGSLFRLPFVHGLDAGAARDALQQRQTAIYAAVPARSGGSSRPADEADFDRPCALAIGSEAHGVSPELRDAALEVSIPTRVVESLNAAVAAGILLYEARRQRGMQA